jgi:threonine dehydrogenase-like Zn-dependent dehydrogenase
MLALVTEPGRSGTARVADLPEPPADPATVLLRALEVGVCGTDREIVAGHFGSAAPGRRELVLGHELLAEVVEDAHGLRRGDLVAATVRRSCGRCAACAAAAPDACLTGAYTERGITALDGFASELVRERPEHLVPVPAHLREIGVLAEPTAVCARALRHVRAVGTRQPWRPGRALVLGTGAIGLLATVLLRLDGLEVWVGGLEAPSGPAATLVGDLGGRYVSAEAGAVPEAAVAAGGFDVVLEATGDGDVMAATLGLLARSGVAVILGIDGRPRDVALDGRLLGVDLVLGNRALIGSVNARADDWRAAVAALEAASAAYGDVLRRLVALRVAPDRFADALAYRGGKAALVFAE